MDEGPSDCSIDHMRSARVLQWIESHRWLSFGALCLLFVFALVLVVWMWPLHEGNQYVLRADGTKIPIHHIALFKGRAIPDALSIHAGEYVEFDSKDGVTHDIALGGGNENGHAHDHSDIDISSGVFGGDEAYQLLIKDKGVYDFHDHLHPDIFATVIAY